MNREGERSGGSSRLYKKAEVKAAILVKIDKDCIGEFDYRLCPDMPKATFYKILKELETDGFLFRLSPGCYRVNVDEKTIHRARWMWPALRLLISMREECQAKIEEGVEFLVEDA